VAPAGRQAAALLVPEALVINDQRESVHCALCTGASASHAHRCHCRHSLHSLALDPRVRADALTTSATLLAPALTLPLHTVATVPTLAARVLLPPPVWAGVTAATLFARVLALPVHAEGTAAKWYARVRVPPVR
jgi:hypothetical protein